MFTREEIRVLKKLLIATNLMAMVLYEGDVPPVVDGLLRKLREAEEAMDEDASETLQNRRESIFISGVENCATENENAK